MTEETEQSLALDYGRIASVLSAVGDNKSALEYYRKNLVLQQNLAAAKGDATSQDQLGRAYFLIARCYARSQDPKSALESYQKSAAVLEPIAAGSRIAQAHLAGTYGYMAPLLQSRGDRAQAIAVQRKSLEILRKLSESDPTNATRREFMDEAYYWMGFYLEQDGDFPQALVNYRHALADFEALASKDPGEVRTRRYVAICYRSIGTSLVSQHHNSQGLQSIRKGLSVAEELPRPQFTGEVADTYDALGFAYSQSATQSGISSSAKLADWEQARAAFQKSLDMYLELQNRGAISTFGAGNPARLKAEVAKCDAALAKLK
jgi:tetratricopeptide (TPR) repeat protein